MASNNEIRQFLSIFVDAFIVSPDQQLNFSPGDKILEIYKSMYPSREMPDNLELEFFSRSFKKHHKIDLSNVWHEDLTLGELFALTRVI